MAKEKILEQAGKSRERLKHIYGDDTEAIFAEQRYGFISGITRKVITKPVEERLFLAAIIPGRLQPKPRIIGIKALP